MQLFIFKPKSSTIFLNQNFVSIILQGLTNIIQSKKCRNIAKLCTILIFSINCCPRILFSYKCGPFMDLSLKPILLTLLFLIYVVNKNPMWFFLGFSDVKTLGCTRLTSQKNHYTIFLLKHAISQRDENILNHKHFRQFSSSLKLARNNNIVTLCKLKHQKLKTFKLVIIANLK